MCCKHKKNQVQIDESIFSKTTYSTVFLINIQKIFEE